MKAREKHSKAYSSNFLDFNSRHFSCDKQHPFSSHVGICPHCLNDRLLSLLCSDCGEPRVSSCSCSQIDLYRHSCSNADVGRISFLIDNNNNKIDSRKRRSFLRRSSSSTNRAGVGEKTNGFSKIKRLFLKKRDKERSQNLDFCDEIFDGEKGFGPNQMELDRFCGPSVFPIEERDSGSTDEAQDEEFCAGRSSKASDHGIGFRSESFEILSSLRRNGICGNGGSCRITMSERGFQKQRSRNYNVWKWIFKNGDK